MVLVVVVVVVVIVLVVLGVVDGGRVEVVVLVELAMGGADVAELFKMSVVGKVIVAGSVVSFDKKVVLYGDRVEEELLDV